MIVTNIERFCMHDGPGLRTTVFLKGCDMRCAWCHNPETHKYAPQLKYTASKCIGCTACTICPRVVHSFDDIHTVSFSQCITCGRCADICPTRALEICGTDMSALDIVSEVLKDKEFYGQNGGVTISGGEPLIHNEVVELVKICKEYGINTCIQTSGLFNKEILENLVGLVDLFLWDIKDTDNARHTRYTGKSNQTIIGNLLFADSLGFDTRIKCILLDGINTNLSHYQSVYDIYSTLSHCEGVEIFAYHSFGASKCEMIGMEGNANADWIPNEQIIFDAKSFFENKGIQVFPQ